MSAKPDDLTFFKAILDPRGVTVLGGENKPFGSFVVIREDSKDNKGINQPAWATAAPGPSKPKFKPLNLSIGAHVHTQQPSSLVIRLTIPFDQVPERVPTDMYGKDLTLRVRMPAKCFTRGESFIIRKLVDDNGNLIMPKANLPTIIQDDKKFEEIKSRIYKILIQCDNTTDIITSDFVMNNVVFEDRAVEHAVTVFRTLISQPIGFCIDAYLLDTTQGILASTFDELRDRFAHENSIGNIYRHFYTQNLQVSDVPHNIDSGTSLKPEADRPEMTTNPPRLYSSKFEMTTRIGVGTARVLAHRKELVKSVNTNGATIRVLEILGAGDHEYYAFINLPNCQLRFKANDTFKVNFRVDSPNDDEEWTFVCIDGFPWALQSELMGILKRPLVALAMDATHAEKYSARALQTTKLPSTKHLPTTIDEARSILENTPAIKCLVFVQESVKAETRVVRACNHIVHGSRMVHNLETGKNARITSETLQKWGDFLLMHDARPSGGDDLFPSPLAVEYLSQLTDEDERAVVDYFHNTSVTYNGLTLGILLGIAGGGKTQTAAHLVVAIMLQDPEARILITAAANPPVDVNIRRINKLLALAQLNLRFSEALKGKFVTRAYSDAAETSYILALADKAHLESRDEPLTEPLAYLMNAMTQVDEGDISGFPEMPYCPPTVVTTDMQPECPLPPHVSTSSFPESARFKPRQRCNSVDQFLHLHEIHPKYMSIPFLPRGSAELEDPTNNEEYICYKFEEDKAKGTLSSISAPFPDQCSDGDSDEQSQCSQDFGLAPSYPRRRRKTKKQRVSKTKKAKIALEEARRVQPNYLANSTAYTLTEEDIIGADNTLTFFGPLLENGGVDLEHPSISEASKAKKQAVDMVRHINRQLIPTISGVRDRRYIVKEFSNATRLLEKITSDPGHAKLRAKYEQLIEEGRDILGDDFKLLITELKAQLQVTKSAGNVIGVTCNNLGVASNQQHLSSFTHVFCDEAGTMSLADLFMVPANVDTPKIILIGDRNQLQPHKPNVDPPISTTRDLGQGVLHYLESNLWPAAWLYLNRRGAPGMCSIVSPTFYRSMIKDAPRTSQDRGHPLTPVALAHFREKFPLCDSSLPMRYFSIYGALEIQDSITGSWVNLDEASVMITIIEEAVLASVLMPKQVAVVTHYTAQQKVFAHAFAKLDEQYPDKGFDLISFHTTDTFQGGQAQFVALSCVRSEALGFTNNKGRCVVAQTRAEDFFIVGANDFGMKTASGLVWMKKSYDKARDLKCNIVIKPGGDHDRYFNHRFVNARLLGTEENAQAIELREVHPPFEDLDQSSPTTTGQDGAGMADITNATDPSWDSSNAKTTTGGKGAGEAEEDGDKGGWGGSGGVKIVAADSWGGNNGGGSSGWGNADPSTTGW